MAPLNIIRAIDRAKEVEGRLIKLKVSFYIWGLILFTSLSLESSSFVKILTFLVFFAQVNVTDEAILQALVKVLDAVRLNSGNIIDVCGPITEWGGMDSNIRNVSSDN